MSAVRRWYILLVCAVSLQAVTWAAILLLRTLFGSGGGRTQAVMPLEVIALQTAIILVGLPVYLVHWLWAQRLARRELQERGSAVRRLYLYATQAGFLGPFAANTLGLAAALLAVPLQAQAGQFRLLGELPAEAVPNALSALVVLGLLRAYHWRVVSEDAQVAPEVGTSATVRRLYLLGFSAAGLIMTSVGVSYLLRWAYYQIADRGSLELGGAGLATETARALVGAAVWMFFWSGAQRLFHGGRAEERESALRKFYLYAAVFVSALAVAASAAVVMVGAFRRMLQLEPRGGPEGPAATILVMLVVWAYHALVLRGDEADESLRPRQSTVRRVYLYLVAAVGLTAMLVGLGGDLRLLIRLGAEGVFGDALREQTAVFTAALVAGLPVWELPWRRVQQAAEAVPPAGAEERRSVVRKIYLYFFLFAATMTALSSLVYLVTQLISLALGARLSVGLLTDLGQAIAFSLIAAGVWVFHGTALRGDSRRGRHDRPRRIEDGQVAIVDEARGRFGRAVAVALQREMPDLSPDLIEPVVTGELVETEGLKQRLSRAALIVGPWTMTAVGGGTRGLAEAVAGSSAHKLLIPLRSDGWDWAGVERWSEEALAQRAAEAVKQWAAGEEVRPTHPLGAGGIIALVILGLLIVALLGVPVSRILFLGI